MRIEYFLSYMLEKINRAELNFNLGLIKKKKKN